MPPRGRHFTLNVRQRRNLRRYARKVGLMRLADYRPHRWKFVTTAEKETPHA